MKVVIRMHVLQRNRQDKLCGSTPFFMRYESQSDQGKYVYSGVILTNMWQSKPT